MNTSSKMNAIEAERNGGEYEFPLIYRILTIVCVLEFLVRSISRFLVRAALASLREERGKLTREELLETGFSSPDDDVPLGVLLKRSLEEKDSKMSPEEKKKFEQEQHEVVVEQVVEPVVEPPKKRARVVKVIPFRCEFRGNKTRCTNQISLNLINHCEKHGTKEERETQAKELEKRHARWCSVRDTNKIVWRIKRYARKMRVKEWVNYHNERFANEKATERFKKLMGL